ncbi:MAG: hypothetical protein LUG16_07825, partial [Candidatus Gastranaerophilales bacterium]|nr:hypothetical protein [Candidatus Gastranaerophilales bacterium]
PVAKFRTDASPVSECEVGDNEVTKGIIEPKAKSMTLYPKRNAEVQPTTATSAKEFQKRIY